MTIFEKKNSSIEHRVDLFLNLRIFNAQCMKFNFLYILTEGIKYENGFNFLYNIHLQCLFFKTTNSFLFYKNRIIYTYIFLLYTKNIFFMCMMKV